MLQHMEKLLAVVSLGQGAYGRWLFQRSVTKILVVLGLTIITSVLIGGIILGGFYATYFMLLNSGMEQSLAMIIIGSALILLITLFILIISRCAHQLLKAKEVAMNKQPPITSYIMSVAQSFLDGLNDVQNKHRR